MPSSTRIFGKHRLVLLLWLLLSGGFLAISFISYQVSKQAIRDALLKQDLPLTSSNIYSEIQKDLVRPILISSTMAHDTFLRDWVVKGERDVDAMARYLAEIKGRYNAFSSFFVSARTLKYYYSEGILKQVSPKEPRDLWYYRVERMREPYEINVDVDLANKDALTIFINYRVFDFDGNFIGVTGVGLTVDAVKRLLADYQAQFHRMIYFVNAQGQVVFFGNRNNTNPDLRKTEGIGPLVDKILADQRGSYQFEAGGDHHILHVNYLPELKWYLFVEQNESAALAGIRQTLYLNLGISLVVTVIVLLLAQATISRYQTRLENMATTDKLTGLLNRHAFTILADRLMLEQRREPRPISLLLIDIDHFKSINDRHGHRIGDGVLEHVAHQMTASLRASDLAVRWGGEEFMLILKGCELSEAERIAENLRQRVEAQPYPVDGEVVSVTLSIGVTQYAAAERMDQTFDRVDAALYRAKKEGRNRIITVPGDLGA